MTRATLTPIFALKFCLVLALAAGYLLLPISSAYAQGFQTPLNAEEEQNEPVLVKLRTYIGKRYRIHYGEPRCDGKDIKIYDESDPSTAVYSSVEPVKIKIIRIAINGNKATSPHYFWVRVDDKYDGFIPTQQLTGQLEMGSGEAAGGKCVTRAK